MKDRRRKVPRMTEDEVRALAMRMFRNEVWLTWADDPAIQMSFPVLILALHEMRKDYIETIGAAYADIANAAPMAVNGLPMFWSCKLLNRDDCIPLWWEYEKLMGQVPA